MSYPRGIFESRRQVRSWYCLSEVRNVSVSASVAIPPVEVDFYFGALDTQKTEFSLVAYFATSLSIYVVLIF
jgi:hypothetical protein